ncbi:CvpA family protein [Methyloligella sp. 2.7D]|uniref:CvpA family protein n=1 Tax=unclassified Methyloligella TaxID=2625955 RepID=UPI00157D226F|nr:CvpA family protein [Methyloligella sp. GL2]QKP77455.1 CvpA family protein [Methyloligella sp. GL2]
MPVSWLDIILVTIMLVSGLLAMVRGFTREVLSIFSWAVAAVAALYLTPKYWTIIEPYFPSDTAAQIIFGVGVFIIVLIVVSLITLRISDRVLDSRVGAVDRTLGFIFGLARGFLLVAIVFVIFSALAKDQPQWIRDARSFPLLQQTQIAIESLIPQNPEEHLQLPGSSEQSTEGATDAPQETTPEAAPATPPAEPAPQQ